MQRRRIAPNSVTFACSLKACGSIGAIEKGRAIHAKIEGMGMLKKRSQVVGNALVDLYAKCGIVAKAVEVFGMLPLRNVVSWNALLTGHGQAGEIESVLSVFDQMRKNGIEPNAVTFLVVLNACSHTGMIDEARKCYCEAVMTGNCMKFPLMGHLICMIDLLSRAGQLEEALGLVMRAPLHPNTVMWLTMLGACRNWRNVELGQRAFEEMVRLDRSDITAYVSMYNIYAETDVLA
jgi:pentatricopeptide repeat protein